MAWISLYSWLRNSVHVVYKNRLLPLCSDYMCDPILHSCGWSEIGSDVLMQNILNLLFTSCGNEY